MVPPTQDQHKRADGGSTNTDPARTKRHSPVRGGTTDSMKMPDGYRSLPSSGRLSAAGILRKSCNYRPSCKRTVSGSNPLTGSKSPDVRKRDLTEPGAPSAWCAQRSSSFRIRRLDVRGKHPQRGSATANSATPKLASCRAGTLRYFKSSRPRTYTGGISSAKMQPTIHGWLGGGSLR
jgi:hypothetical protein